MIGNRPNEMEQLQVGKWYVWVDVRRSYARIDPLGWRILEVGVFSPNTAPKQGELFEDYKGFVWRLAFWLPFERA